MCEEKAIEYYNAHKDFDYIILDSDNKISYSQGLENSISVNEDFLCSKIK